MMCNLSKSPEEKAYIKARLYLMIWLTNEHNFTVWQAMTAIGVSDDERPEYEWLVEKVKSLLHEGSEKVDTVSFALREESWIDDLIGVIPNADFLVDIKEFERIEKENGAISKAVAELSVLSQDEANRLNEAHEEAEQLKKLALERYQARIKKVQLKKLGTERYQTWSNKKLDFEIGEKRGIALVKKVMKLSLENKNPQVIADYCEVSLETVLEILE